MSAMYWVTAAIAFAAVAGASWAGTALVLRYLTKRRIFDRPNPRSSHSAPTPRGGGIAVVAVLVPALGVLGWRELGMAPGMLAAFLLPAVLLALVSWRDDVAGLGALPRLAAQVAAVAAGLTTLPVAAVSARLAVPAWLLYGAAGLAWVWFVNLFNFMDGIDGISGVEAASIGLGTFLLAFLAPGLDGIGLCGLAVAAAALGFLWWNWAPARIFLGDVGSVPLGYLLGWVLLHLAASPAWPAALILPLYYLADSTVTLLRRLARGDKVWRAHKEHFYQRGTQNGRSHALVVLFILGGNVALIGLAAGAALAGPWLFLALAALVVGGLFRLFTLPAKKAA